MGTSDCKSWSQRPEYPAGIPSKFTPNGDIVRFPGNTTVCHIPAKSPLIHSLETVYATIKSHPHFSKTVHLLPKDSWHMTVFDGVCERKPKPELWPAGKAKQSLDEFTQEIAPKLRQLGLELKQKGLAPPYRMKGRGFDPALVGIAIEVEGADPAEEQRMRRLRDEISKAMGLRASDHEEYIFHVSIAYLLQHIDGEDRQLLNEMFAELLPVVKQEFELGPVEFNTFEDMSSYPRLFYLGEAETNIQT